MSLSRVTALANGIKVATLNNGVKGVQVGLYAKGSGAEAVGETGKMNMLSNCINLNHNPKVVAQTDRKATTIKSIGASGLSRIHEALNTSVNQQSLDAAKELSHAQALNLDNDWFALAREYSYRAGFMLEPLGQPVMGSTQQIEDTEVSSVEAEAKYLNNNGLNIVAVGNVDHDAFVKECDEKFGKMASATGKPELSYFCGSQYQHRFDSTNFATQSVLLHVPPPGHQAHLDFQLLAAMNADYDPREIGAFHSVNQIKRAFAKRANAGNDPGGFNYAYFDPGWNVSHMNITHHNVGANSVIELTTKLLGQKRVEYGTEDLPHMFLMKNLGSTYRRATSFHLQMAKNRFLIDLAKDLEENPLDNIGKSLMDYGYVRDVSNLKNSFKKITIDQLKDNCYLYLVDAEVARGFVGCTEKLIQFPELKSHLNPKFAWM